MWQGLCLDQVSLVCSMSKATCYLQRINNRRFRGSQLLLKLYIVLPDALSQYGSVLNALFDGAKISQISLFTPIWSFRNISNLSEVWLCICVVRNVYDLRIHSRIWYWCFLSIQERCFVQIEYDELQFSSWFIVLKLHQARCHLFPLSEVQELRCFAWFCKIDFRAQS